MFTRPVDYYRRDLNMLGMVFRLVALEPGRPRFGNPCWTYEGPSRETSCHGLVWRIDAVADASLTPMRGDYERVTRSIEPATQSLAMERTGSRHVVPE